MEEFLYLIFGLLILSLSIYDFFFTTLSGSGAGFIAEHVSKFSNKSIQLAVKLFGRSAYKIQGLFVNLMVLSAWILLVWFGLFLVFSWNPEAITNSSGRVANAIERLYFTSYILSTLGMGNFIPTSAFFEIVTSIFSFFGFIFFTSSMTYFISVSSALVNKRTLAKSINSLGQNPQQIAKKFTSMDSSYSYQQFLDLQDKIDKHAVNHHAYPVVHFYTESEAKNCLSLNLTRLDEALSILIASKDAEKLQEELEPLRSTITSFLNNLEKNFSNSMPTVDQPVASSKFPYQGKALEHENLENRRRILQELFKSEGFKWDDILN